MRPFHDPSSCFESWVSFLLLDFFGARFDVGSVMTPFQEFADAFGIVAFVETHVLSSCRWLRAMDGNAVESGLEKFDIVCVGTADRHT